MRLFSATAALCLAVALVPSAQALARARHHHALPRVAPLPPERPDITSLFSIVKRSFPGSHVAGPDGLAERSAK